MKTMITFEEVDQVIDATENYAKTQCDLIYEKAANIYGKIDHFKELLDDLFDSVSKNQIKLMRAEIRSLFSHYSTESIPVMNVAEYAKSCRENQEIKMSNGFKMGGRSYGKTSETATFIIVSACRAAFMQKLAEYIQDDT